MQNIRQHNRSHASRADTELRRFQDVEAGFWQQIDGDRPSSNRPASTQFSLINAESVLVVLDEHVDEADWLADQVTPGMRVLRLRSQASPAESPSFELQGGAIAQITTALRENPDICHLVLVAHGAAGSLTLAGGLFDREALLCCDADAGADWQLWRSRLSTIALYSCGVAAGTLGRDFLQALHHKTGVAIAAATGYIGHASRGGTWDLDVWVGDRAEVENLPQPFSTEVQNTYPGLLATLVVNSAADTSVAGDGLLTLREAIAAANSNTGSGADTIVFDSSLMGSTISLTQGELAITSDVTIDASAAANLIISGNNASRVFNITSGTTTLVALTVADGSAANGAGIRVADAALNLERSLVTANADSSSGGGIYATNAVLSLLNSTISGNSSAEFGAGMTLDGGTSATITFSTIVANQGSGIDLINGSTLSIGHTLLADNTRGNIPLSFANTTSLGYNITDDITIGLNQPTDKRAQSDEVINLAPLGDYGGPTHTHALLPGSIAIDGGNPTSAVNVDQRGVLRPVQERLANRVDVGAFEAARPVVTVDALATDDNTPELTGTVLLPGNLVDPNLTITVAVNGTNYTAINNGDGTWTVTDGAIAPLADGTYDVVASATNISGTRTDATNGELIVDATAPIITVDTLFTNDGTPQLTGTVDDANASITVIVNGVSYTAINTGSGTWVLEDGSITTPLTDGTYNVQVTATDAIGNIGTDATNSELTVDTVAPTVTVNPKSTGDSTPSLSGTVNDAAATVQVQVNGVTYAATNNSNGTWALADGTITPALIDGVYDVQVSAIDLAGNVGADETLNELQIDTIAPEITVTPLTTRDTTPQITGTVNEPGANITVQLNGTVYGATNNGDGTWSLNNVIVALADGTYDVAATATDATGNVATDTTVDELVIDTAPPGVTVDTLVTNDSTPAITGTVDDNTATLVVVVNGVTYNATNNGDGTWTLADNTITPALADGTYGVQVTATDTQGNAGIDGTVAELTIDTVAPTVTVAAQSTSDNTPAFSGAVNDTSAIVEVTVNGVTYDALNNGDGTWTLADDVVETLADGVYEVEVTATDLAGNIGTDATTNELLIDTTEPVITVDSTTTNDRTPVITGTISEADASIQVLINGTPYSVTNSGDGFWALPDNTITPALADGTYDIVATATDLAGNIGTDNTADELVIDAIAPIITIDNLSTNNPSPALAGTLDDPDAVVQVTVNRDSFIATNNGNGTWSLPAGSFTLVDGSYEIEVAAIDAAGNIGSDTGTLVLDSTAPVVTVDPLATNDATPALTGAVDDPTATVTVTVDGSDYTATNNADGTWTLADDLITPALDDGTFDISVAAEDAAGNVGIDDTIDELLVDTVVPVVSVDIFATNDTSPPLTGLVDDPSAIVEVTVVGSTYEATNNGDGTWTLADNTITPELADGFYDVAVVATDSVGNIGQDATNNELLIDATAPVVTVDSLLTTATTPTLTGTVDDDEAAIAVTLNGIIYTAANNADGTWSLDGSLINPPLLDGVYDVEVSATDAVGNIGTDATADELTIDTIAPVVAVNPLSTNDDTPTLTGTIDDAIASLVVTVNGTDYDATNNGDGTWQLTIPTPLADDTYDVSVTATDLVGNVGTDATTNELLVDTVAPVVTVNSLITNDSRPALTGTVDDPEATVRIRVGGTTYTANNNGNGTWTLPDNVIFPALGDNTFNVAAIATDAVGNVGRDQTVNELQIDATAPQVDIVDVTPDPRGPVDAITIQFDSVVFGFTRFDLTLERDGEAVSLSGATLETSDRMSWTLNNLTAETTLTGRYTLTLAAAGSNIIDGVGNLLQISAADTWQVNNFTVSGLPAPRSVGGRTGTPFPAIDFRGGRRGIREVGTNKRDVIRGTGRRDRLIGRRGGDRLSGRGGNDRLFGDGGTDTLRGGGGNDRLEGGGRRDRLEGQRGRDRLNGGRGIDTLLGGGGNDELIGGGGNDFLTGGNGNDVFVFDSLTNGVDTITDFSPTRDQIDLRGILSGSQFAAASSFAKLNQFVRLQQIGTTTVVSLDADGNGSGEALRPIVLLENVDADTVVSTNFVV
ncbi:MAG: Ig-like domain-containing protein [Elainellaceae cyanobacterium]